MADPPSDSRPADSRVADSRAVDSRVGESRASRWWRQLRQPGLRLKLTLLFTAATIVLVTVGGIALAVVLRQGLNDNVDAALRARLDQIDADALLTAAPDGLPPSAGVEESLTQVLARDGAVLYSLPANLPAAISPADAQAAGSQQQTRTIEVHGTRVRIMWMAEADADRVLVAGTDLSATQDNAADINGVLLWSAPILVIVAGMATWLLAGAALAPVERMRTDAAAISSTDSDRRISVPPTDDSLAALARTLNQMLDRLHDALRRERDFVADAGHELRTPLSVLRTELELAGRPGRSTEDLRDAIEHAAAEVDRLTALSTSLLELARAESTRSGNETADVPTVLDDAIRARRAAALDADVDLVADYPRAAGAVIDPAGLRQVVDNALSNALRHTPAGGAVVVRTEPSGRWLDVHITDTGPGMPEEFLPHAFDRFRMADSARTTNGDGGAHAGLGLAIARAIVDAAGGSIIAANVPEGGLDIRIRLRATGR